MSVENKQRLVDELIDRAVSGQLKLPTEATFDLASILKAVDGKMLVGKKIRCFWSLRFFILISNGSITLTLDAAIVLYMLTYYYLLWFFKFSISTRRRSTSRS